MLIMRTGTSATDANGLLLTAQEGTIESTVSSSRLFLLQEENDSFYVVPVHLQKEPQSGSLLWILPDEIESDEPCYQIRTHGQKITVTPNQERYDVAITKHECVAYLYQNRPHCDIFGISYSFETEHGEAFERTLAAFYWDSILPMTAERTIPKNSSYRDGYVLSTLQKNAYPSTYPDVDHEFQIKGRLALGDKLSLDVVRRMMELQLAVMRKDPSGQWRNPCAIRRNGFCEYHVPRRSKNLRKRALMFLLTGNIELIESAWLYLFRSKDTSWLNRHITDLERVISLVERYIDKDFRLWSEVYYEDQVIKHGRETIAQAFAIHSFQLLADMERLLLREEQVKRYEALAENLAKTLAAPFPLGYWDAQEKRFLDWVDRDGTPHDHLHLLANELPVLFGCASEEQSEHVSRLIQSHDDVFQKFPSFVAAKIEDYTSSEIGSGGPYDLCAAGRYWCWDAAYRRSRGDSDALNRQLAMVADQAMRDGYIMGERYDMNYVYYKSEQNWHGAAHYYEYPNVFAWVLIHEYFGIRPALDCDYLIQPCLSKSAKIRYGEIAYSLSETAFTICNVGEREIRIRVDLSLLSGRIAKNEQETEQIYPLAQGEELSFLI